eukprot:7239126-Pyramimonas_sp.AAC.1
MVSRHPPRSGGAALEEWEVRELKKKHGIPTPFSLKRGLPGGVGRAQNLINKNTVLVKRSLNGSAGKARNRIKDMVSRYSLLSGEASLDRWAKHET